MTPGEAIAAVLDALRTVAPDAAVGALDPDADLAEQLGLDSLDFVRVVDLVAERTGVVVPDDRFADAATASGFAAVLAEGGPDEQHRARA